MPELWLPTLLLKSKMPMVRAERHRGGASRKDTYTPLIKTRVNLPASVALGTNI